MLFTPVQGAVIQQLLSSLWEEGDSHDHLTVPVNLITPEKVYLLYNTVAVCLLPYSTAEGHGGGGREIGGDGGTGGGGRHSAAAIEYERTLQEN